MRKLFVSLAVTLTTAAFAQVLNVGSVEKIDLKGTRASVVAGISPKGDYLLLTGAQLNGLAKYDLTKQKIEVISSARGAGQNAVISSDGSTVVYREDSFVEGLRYTDVNVKNLATGAKKQLVKAARNVNAVSVQGQTAVLMNNGRATKAALASTRAAKRTAPVASIVNRQLVLDVNGKTKTLSPNGEQFSYIWPSVSPDGSKVCYYVCGRGCYVCDLNGKIVADLGKVRAAKWLDNSVIVGMNDTDNGHVIVSSEIVATTLDGKRQVLTDSALTAMYPYPSANGKKIVFSTNEGETYMINIK